MGGCASNLSRTDPSGNCVCDPTGCNTGGGGPGTACTITNISGIPNPLIAGRNYPGTVRFRSTGLYPCQDYSFSASSNRTAIARANAPANQTTCSWDDPTSFTIRALTPGNATITFEGNAHWIECSASIGVSVIVPSHPVSGTVYDDPGRQATLNGNTCELAGATPVLPGLGSTMTTSYQTTNINGDGTYSVLAQESPPDRTVTLNIGDTSTWACTCPAGCSYAVNSVAPGITNQNYYVSQVRASWFQTVSGDVHAGNGGGNMAIHNPIPATCQTPGCKPYTTTRDDSGTAGSSGVISYNNGTLDTYATYGNQTQNLDEDARSYLVNTDRDKPVENFAYFMRHLEMPRDPADDFPNDPHDAAYPANPSVGNKPAYYRNGDLTILSTPWNVASGDGRVIFVDGNLTIGNTIDVAVGGSLTFIVSGDIIFPATFGDANHAATASLVDGIFIADGIIDIQSAGGLTPDLKFIGEGSFIGLSGVRLDRDFHSTDNNIYPAELFRFRPDLVVNIHNAIKKPIFSWKQVAP